MKQRIQKAKRRPKHEHPLRNFEMYFSWSIESLQRTTQRWVLQLWLMRRLLRMCWRRLMHGRRGRWPTSIFIQVRYLPRLPCSLLPDDPRAAFASQPGLAAGWVGAFWPTMDEEPVPKETTEITSSSQHKSHKSHPSNPSSHCHPPLMEWYSTPLLQCKSSGMTHIACFPPPLQQYMLQDCKDMAEGHT